MSTQSWSPAFNKGPGVIVANAHMLAAHLPKLQIHEFDLLIVDEGFQLGAAGFMPVSDLAERMLNGWRSRAAATGRLCGNQESGGGST